MPVAILAAAAVASPSAVAERWSPVLVHDARDRSPLTDVSRAPVAVPGLPAPGPPTAYARVTGERVQYWLFYADNPQDRGLLRTGRHAGDWELVQVELGPAGDARRVIASQHSGAEGCAYDAVRHDGTHPVVFVANGSHAGYFRRGTRDRTFPDPNDEARGDGRVVRPRVQLVTASAPAWMRWPGRWGATRAGVVPGEMDSPRGPAFQGERWDRAAAFARSARACAAAAPVVNRRETAITAAALLLVVLAAAATVRRRRDRRR